MLFLSLLLADALTPTVAASALPTADIDAAAIEVADCDAVVVTFLKPGCPIANYYHPTMRRLADGWGDRVLLIQVHATATVAAEQARAHRDEYEVAGRIVVDPAQTLARALDAKVTPEAFVLVPVGGSRYAVRYRGRIDDTYVGFGRRRQTVGDHTLRDAVNAVLSSQPVDLAQTDAIGCRIHYAD